MHGREADSVPTEGNEGSTHPPPPPGFTIQLISQQLCSGATDTALHQRSVLTLQAFCFTPAKPCFLQDYQPPVAHWYFW